MPRPRKNARRNRKPQRRQSKKVVFTFHRATKRESEAIATEAANSVRAVLDSRAMILSEACDLTLGARNRTYGDPFENFDVTTQLKRVFWGAVARSNHLKAEHTGNDRIDAIYAQNTPFGHSIDMILTNLGRIATTPSADIQRDRYLDTAAYAAIAYEVGVKSALLADSTAPK